MKKTIYTLLFIVLFPFLWLLSKLYKLITGHEPSWLDWR